MAFPFSIINIAYLAAGRKGTFHKSRNVLEIERFPKIQKVLSKNGKKVLLKYDKFFYDACAVRSGAGKNGGIC